MLGESLVERIECGAKSLSRGARRLIGETLFGGALPERNLSFLLGILRPLHGARTVGRVAVQRLGRFRRSRRIKYKTEAQGPQVEV